MCTCVLAGNPFTRPSCASPCECRELTPPAQTSPFCTWNHFAVAGSHHGLLVIDHFLGVSSFDGQGVCQWPTGTQSMIRGSASLFLCPLSSFPDGVCGLSSSNEDCRSPRVVLVLGKSGLSSQAVSLALYNDNQVGTLNQN